MSRIANQPVELPKGVEVNLNGQEITVKGGKGSLNHRVHDSVEVAQEDNVIRIAEREGAPNSHAMAGTSRALIANMVQGVTTGFSRVLEINGVGYRALVKGKSLELSLGYSHPITFPLKEGIEAEVEKNTITIKGINKETVGQTAADIRALRPPEPYKGKGIKYADERILRKAGKTTK